MREKANAERLLDIRWKGESFKLKEKLKREN